MYCRVLSDYCLEVLPGGVVLYLLVFGGGILEYVRVFLLPGGKYCE